jgi:hypothetical protein
MVLKLETNGIETENQWFWKVKPLELKVKKDDVCIQGSAGEWEDTSALILKDATISVNDGIK